MIVENQESYCIVQKSEGQLDTELKQHNDSLIGLFYYASELSKLSSEEDIHKVANKTGNLKNSHKNLVCDLASMKSRLQK